MYLIKSCLCRIISLTIVKSLNDRRVIKAPSSNICWEMWKFFFRPADLPPLPQIVHAGKSFGELLKLAEMDYLLSCDPEVGGCGKKNFFYNILSTSPHVFTAGLLLVFKLRI